MSERLKNPALAESYDALEPLVRAMHREFQELSKKRADAALSSTKVALVNRLLKEVYEIFTEEPQRPFLDLLDEDNIPQNSDVVLILGQVCAALSAFREKYTYSCSWQFEEDDNEENISSDEDYVET